MGLVFVGLIFIFLDALGLLQDVFNFFEGTQQGEVVGSAILLIVIVTFIIYITQDRKSGSTPSSDSSK